VTLRSTLWLMGLVVSAAVPRVASAQEEFIPPADSGWVNIRDLGAKGDGRTDDTAAFQSLPKPDYPGVTVYIPDGIYLLSDTWLPGKKQIILQGQSRSKTILRLKRGSAGFGDAAKPKPFISLGTEKFMDKKGNMGQAFNNSVRNLTIEVEPENAGAVALHYLNNNTGCVRNVTIRSHGQGGGLAGLGLVRTGLEADGGGQRWLRLLPQQRARRNGIF
jgi:hypothetical protein